MNDSGLSIVHATPKWRINTLTLLFFVQAISPPSRDSTPAILVGIYYCHLPTLSCHLLSSIVVWLSSVIRHHLKQGYVVALVWDSAA
jgi:hypothetical protein